MITALHERQHGLLGDFFGKSDTAGAGDAAFSIEHHIRSERNAFVFVVFLFVEAAFAFRVEEFIFLKLALPCFIADWAIEGVINEKELHDSILSRLGLAAESVDDHTVGNGCRAGNRELWSPADDLITVGISLEGAVGSFAGKPCIDKAHTAIT